MNEQELQAHLTELIFDDADDNDEHPDLRDANVYTFLEYGLMTRDTGLVVQLSNGDVFELTIQKR